MIQRVLPAFWCLIFCGLFWIGAGVYLDSSLAFLLGTITTAGPLWTVFSNVKSTHGSRDLFQWRLHGVKPIVPIDGLLGLRLEVSSGALLNLTLDTSGAPVHSRETSTPSVKQGLVMELLGVRYGETRLSGVWVSRLPNHGLFMERHYVPIERRWRWGLGGLGKPQPDTAFSTGRNTGVFGEIRPWSFGDTRFQIDRRASLRTGHLMVREREVSHIGPVKIVVGPFDALWLLDEERVQHFLSETVHVCIAEAASKSIEVILWSSTQEEQVEDPASGTALWAWLEGFFLSTEESFRRSGDIDPYFLKEHLVASQRIREAETHAPSAWIRWFERRFPGSSTGINAYWEANGTVTVSPRIRKEKMIERFAEVAPRDGSDSFGIVLDDELRRCVDALGENDAGKMRILELSRPTPPG